MPGIVQLITVVYIALTALDQANATCCPLKSVIPPMCCGVGKCNVFCCNCDNGCVPDCQACPLGECAAVLAGCVAACVDPAEPACVACLGSLYNVCRACFDTSDGVETDQLLFFNDTNWEEALCGNNVERSSRSSGTAISTNGLLLLSAIGTIICIFKIY